MKKVLTAVIQFPAAFAACLAVLVSCSGGFISDKAYLRAVEDDFKSRAVLMEKAGICLDSMSLTKDEKEAMEFLYSYMPLGDVLNYPAEYYLDNFRLTQQAVRTMPWGKTVPERELRHFVLPVRVNNENLDTSRAVFYKELAPRLAGLSMKDAILEVNHWCHEKAVYQPSDSRTSSPLATVRTACGRCGEESTFLVAALRSVAIPARQVYTPRWAHTDDNHAWVEAWADGEWHFLGACEPEPVLDLGWFNAPASRGMLMHTKVFGRYDGPEEVVSVSPNYTEINVIHNYAPESARLDVTVQDLSGAPVPGARVEYRLYNYAEFYPVAVKTADDAGRSYLTAGLGDMVVYATDGENYGFSKVTFGRDRNLTVTLSFNAGNIPGHLAFESVPPVENAVLPEVTPEQRAINDMRMAQEDSLRNAYTDTFFDRYRAEAYCAGHGLPEEAAALLVSSRGNHEEIKSFLASALSCGRADDAVALLKSVSEKDLRDTPSSVFEDHLFNTPAGEKDIMVYCPRVSSELLSPFRGYFRTAVPDDMLASIAEDPSSLVVWCRDSLELMDSISMKYVQIRPSEVWRTRVADKDSREIFFVSLCRTSGVPAWKDPVTGIVRYRHDGRTYDVDFDAAAQTAARTGTLRLEFSPIPLLENPQYYRHFTLSRLENGTFSLLSFPESATWKTDFAAGAELPEGIYALVSGARMSGGNVLADVDFFRIETGRTTVSELVVRDDPSQYRVIGTFNSEALYDKVPTPSKDAVCTKERKSVLSETGRGYFAVVLADYGREPVDHAMRDISAAAAELEAWGRPLLVIFATEDDWRRFDSDKYSLPSTVSYGIDSDGSMREMMMAGMDLRGNGMLPLVTVADTFNRVVFFSQGYSIGLGERLVKVSKSL